MKRLLIIIAVWVGCGWISSGILLAEFQRKYPDQDQSDIIRMAYAFGPAMLPAAMFSYHGRFTHKQFTCEERLKFFTAHYGTSLGIAEFNHFSNCDLKEVK